MSVIHINQIRKRLDTLFKTIVDMSDQKVGTKTYDDMLLSRSLAAYQAAEILPAGPRSPALKR